MTDEAVRRALIGERTWNTPYACERGSFPLDLETGRFVYGWWQGDHCEVVALQGYLSPGVDDGFGPPLPRFSASRCDTDAGATP